MLLFNKLKWVICGLLVLLLASASAWLVSASLKGTATTQAESGNKLIYQIISSVIWPKYKAEATGGNAGPALTRDMQTLGQNPGIIIRLYNAQGVILYTSGGTLSASEFGAQVQALGNPPAARHNEVKQNGGTWLHSFAPIGNGTPEAYLEMFRDVSALYSNIFYMQLAIAGGIALIAGGLLATLAFIARPSESVLARLHDENQAISKEAQQARAALREKVDFLATVSHEVRTPLNAIIGFSDVLKIEAMDYLKLDIHKNYINDINKSSNHLLTVINDILDFSKAEAGKLELEVSEVNLNKLVLTSLRLVTPRAEAGQVELVNALPKQPLALETDAKRLKQVLLNLLSNAVKFTPEGGKVRIAAWEDGGNIILQVSDVGVGMDPKDIAKALSEFGQVQNKLSKRYEGTGLGLPLARKFVETLGGKFGINSFSGRGTTVFFQLPKTFRPVGNIAYRRTQGVEES